MDGSQKLQQRLIDGANDLAKINQSATRICKALAIWVHYLAVSDRVNDPIGPKLKELAQGQNPDEVVKAIFSLDVFPRPLNSIYFPEISEALEALRSEPLVDTLLP